MFGRGPGDFEASVFQPAALGAGHDSRDERRTWYVVLASPYERRIFEWQDGFDVTHTPVERLWGPGSWTDINSALDQGKITQAGDSVALLDRIFYVRILPNQAELPRTAVQVKELREQNSDERWFIMQADDPRDALVHARNVADGVCPGGCGCAVNVLRDSVKRLRVDEFIRSGARAVPGPRGSGDG